MKNNKKAVGFDLDGTLTQHKSPLDERTRQMLVDLSKRYRLVMVGAGACERIYRQMNEFPIEIIGNYGMQRSEIHDGKFVLVENLFYPINRPEIERRAAVLREEFNLKIFHGDSVEFHQSGVITFPLLGTTAPIEEKLACDPTREKRRKMFERVKDLFPDYNVFIGGSSSFDMSPLGYDKYQALLKFCARYNLTPDEVLYVGDDFGPGGNDSQVLLGGIDCVEIDDYRTTPDRLSFLLQ